MSELQFIQTTLKRSAQRRRAARALHGLWRGLLFGALLAFLLIGLYKLLPLPLWTLYLIPGLPLAGMLIGACIGGWRTPALIETARWVDGHQKLQERLGTALEVAPKTELGSWRDLVITDAAAHARKLDPRKLVTFRLNRAAPWALLFLVVIAGLGFVPEYRTKSYLQKKTDEQNIRSIGKQLTDLTRRSLEKRPPALITTQKAMDAALETGTQLSKANLSRSEALKDLASVAEKLKNELNTLGRDPALRRMEQAARGSGSRDSQTAAAMQRELEALQKQMGTPSANADTLDKLQKQLEQMRDAVASQNANNANMSDSERNRMSAALSALSAQMQGMGLQIPEIEAAIQALAANQTDMVLKDLQAALTDLSKIKEMAKNMQQLQQQLEKIGKDLAEQLQNGQPEAAQMTLQKMMQQLKSSELSPEQLSKVMQDVSKAIKPAGNYGDVSKFLKDAAAKMNSGDKRGAAGELANAARELDKLMQQLGDAQSLAAELQTLNDASMFLASGQAWIPGKKPAYGQGGRPGSGVGTWAENEAGEWNGEMSASWDNSGFERADQDPRGLADRDPSLNEALQPTKVRGQFTPGSQMPSITLKGVSIKGQSRVEYEASATAAQSDAESALSQEKVPRAYQGAVKEYFDDLKK